MAIFAVALLMLWSRDRSRIETLALGFGWALLSLGFSTSILAPDHWGRATVAITYVPYALAACFVSWGLLTRIKVVPPLRAHLVIALTGICVMALTQKFGDNVVSDIYVANLTCGVIMVTTAQLYARASKRDWVDQFMLVMIVVTCAQFFIRPVLSLMFDGPVAANAYRDTFYYLALNWVFAFGSVLFGLSQIAGVVKDQIDAMRHASAIDILSGLLVRGEFEAQVHEALTNASATEIDVALVVGDIDHFKQVNDIWGHQIGDAAIADFGRMVSDMIRGTDIVGRIGGEEFCILVWNANEDVAATLAERLRTRTATLDLGKDALNVRLTASFGVAERQRGETYRALFARADKALYEAKQSGRNCVVCSSAQQPDPADETQAPSQGTYAA